MHRETTVEPGRSKTAPFSDADGTALADPLDIDRFLALGPYRFWDALLDAPPRAGSVDTLVRLGLPRHLLTHAGTVREAFALLEARRRRGLASVPQARRLRAAGAPRLGL
jgi:hypothetical protein